MKRITFRKDSVHRWSIRSYTVSLNGIEVGTIQQHEVGSTAWFWWARHDVFGIPLKNTSNQRLSLDDAKAEIKQYILQNATL